MAGGLLTLKESLELGSTGRFLKSVDAVPPDFYELVLQIGKVTSDQKAMQRFLEYPGIQGILAESTHCRDLERSERHPGLEEKSIFS